MKPITLFLFRLLLSILIFGAFIVSIQDLLIFPGLYSSYLTNRKSIAPDDITEIELTGSDGNLITVWHYRPENRKQVAAALLFHGNAEHLENFVDMQRWLASMGIASYTMEYRGYNGRSSGWPSELGIYKDSEATLDYILTNENTSADKILVLGSSIGAGVAAYIASQRQVKTLVLLSPYASLTSLVAQMPLYNLFTYFLKYSFPVNEYVAQLKNTNLILVHGKQDTIIPFEHSEQLIKSYLGNGQVVLLADDIAGHNNLLVYTREQLAEAMKANSY